MENDLHLSRLPAPQKRRRRQAPARGLAAVYSHLHPIRNETQHPSPLLVGPGCVNTSPKALVAGTAGPQADGPCSWAVRRLLALPPHSERNAERPPPARGAGVRRPRANGTGRPHCGHSRILVTTPEPTVRPPSRMAKRRPSSHAIGVIKVISMSMLSPGMTISTPSGSLMLPVTSVVRK